ncbi:MAG: cobalamin-dependent protein [Erythrobacter sp.]|jgi:methanogenic corrinoid protein MtbC1|nr:cobalamin-dependent protein [Erythrobacter sp.]
MIGAGSAALRNLVGGSIGRRKPAPSDSTSHRQALADDSINTIIEGEIIPRLLMAHALENHREQPRPDREIRQSEAERFAVLPLRLEAPGLFEEVQAFIAQGVSIEAIYIDLLAPAARRLGELWESDDCDFIEVTMGLWRLQEVMREVSARVPATPAIPAEDAPRALFAAMPGDQHNFGPMIMDDVFARAGWDTVMLLHPLRKEVLDSLSREPFDVVGLTLSRDCPSAALTNVIKAMRSVSCNPHLSILVGGRMINQNPAIVAEVGADGTGADARAALEVARALVQSAEVRAHTLK